jgi:predicted MPP superfamily phosphohydrolase
MGSVSEHFLDFAVLFAIVAVQWLIARAMLRVAARRFGSGTMRALRVVPWLAAAWMLAGFLVSFPGVHPGLPLWLSGLLRGSTYIWVLCSTAGYFIQWGFHQLAQQTGGVTDPGRRKLLHMAGTAAAGAPFAAIAFGALIGRTDFRVREIDIPIEDLPPDLVGLRITLLSDIHLSPYLSESEFARAIDMANETKPHLALLTGDLITTASDPLDACLRQAARLRSDAGTWGCLGNHEIYAGAQDYVEQHGARAGLRFLRSANQVLRFGNARLNLAGVDYQSIRRPERYLQGVERLVVPGAVNLLLSHNPDVFPVAARKGYDLTVAGHTHGGQVNVEILHQQWNIARFLTPYIYGVYETREPRPSRVYVTRGIGSVGLPARIGAPPEIAALRLRKA